MATAPDLVTNVGESLLNTLRSCKLPSTAGANELGSLITGATKALEKSNNQMSELSKLLLDKFAERIPNLNKEELSASLDQLKSGQSNTGFNALIKTAGKDENLVDGVRLLRDMVNQGKLVNELAELVGSESSTLGKVITSRLLIAGATTEAYLRNPTERALLTNQRAEEKFGEACQTASSEFGLDPSKPLEKYSIKEDLQTIKKSADLNAFRLEQLQQRFSAVEQTK